MKCEKVINGRIVYKKFNFYSRIPFSRKFDKFKKQI